MGKYATANDVRHVVMLGDNFYSYGIQTNSSDCRFKKTFEDIYDAASLQDIPFYVIAGNHDHRGNVTAQIEYTQRSQRWEFPDWYYTWTDTFEDNRKEVSVQFILYDSVLADSADGKYGERSNEPGKFTLGAAIEI